MIEVVGWGVRVPGARGKSNLWSLLKNGECAISAIPEDRWSWHRFWHPRITEQGKSYTFAAGVLDDLWGFDPGVFGISPREAEQMDPQQRLLLQVTWEAIEDAGIAPAALAGETVGVYVGASTLDYSIESFFDPSIASGHFMTGNTLSVIANRLSYVYDLNGPSFTVDTACSSSLVALNEAVKALNAGEIDTAIVAGVNALVSPFPFIGFAQATMLSPEGLCRAFDERGMGYVRSEGSVAFVLRRSDASPWCGQRSAASIIDVGINSDGRTVGMSLPSQQHQSRLLNAIYERSAIDPNDVAFIEAHGTGTRVGDPAEAGSIGEAIGVKRNSALPIGSIKTNIGHLEPASGLAGLAKAVLALENDLLPASLHCEQPNPDIDFDALNVRVATEPLPLPKVGKRRYAGVNSFGFGGTNAHVVLADPLEAPRSLKAERSGHESSELSVLALSAKSKAALGELAHAFAEQLATTNDGAIGDLSAAAWHRKPSFEEKLVVSGKDRSALAKALSDYVHETKSDCVQAGNRTAERGTCAFVFSGNGAQWPGMGIAAYRTNSAFKSAFDDISKLFSEVSGVSLTDLLHSDTLEDDLKLTSKAQPLLFAVQVALCKALEQYGLRPDIVLGHSVGEVAAAVVSGVMPLNDAIKLVYHRSHEQEAVAGFGTMAALVVSEADAAEAVLKAECPSIEIAAVNSPKSVSLSGSLDDIETFGRFARAQHLAFRKVDLNYPFHSSLIDVVERPFRDAVGEMKGKPAHTSFVSTVTGAEVSGEDIDTGYWWLNLRDPVRFSDALAHALEKGARTFIEIGPKPILQSYMRQIAAAQDCSVVNMPSLSADQNSLGDPVLDVVMRALVNGVDVDADMLFGQNPDRHLPLPGYPWQQTRFHFVESDESNSGLLRGSTHPLVGWSARERSNTWTAHVDTQVLPFLADHEIDGQVIFPGAAYIEMGLWVGRTVFDGKDVEIRDLDIVQAMFLSDEHLTEIQTRFFPETGSFEISSRRRLADEDWSLNAKGRIFTAVSHPPIEVAAPGNVESVPFDADNLYRSARSFGLNYGPAFRRASHLEITAEKTCRVSLRASDEEHPFDLHPAELDACFHGIFALLTDTVSSLSSAKAYVPVHFDCIHLLREKASVASADIVARRSSQESLLADFVLHDAAGDVVCTISGARFRAVKFGGVQSEADLVFYSRSEPVDDFGLEKDEKRISVETPDEIVARIGTSGDKAGLLTTGDGESRLLLEAAAQRLAIDVLSAFKSAGDVVREQDFPEDLRLFLNALVNWLVVVEAGSETHPGIYKLANTGDLPEFDLLINAVLEDSPSEIATATLLTRSRAAALDAANGDSVLFDPPGALLDHLKFASPDAKARLALVKAWLAPALEAWTENRPLRVLDLGGAGLELARHIVAALPAGRAFVTVADPAAASAARLKAANENAETIEVLDASKGADALKEARFDLVVSSGRLHEFIDAGAFLTSVAGVGGADPCLMAIEPERSLLADAMLGMVDGWLELGAGEEFPLSRLKSSKEWAAILRQETPLEEVEARNAFVEGHAASLLRALPSSEEHSSDDDVSEKDSDAFWYILSGSSSVETARADAISERLAVRGIKSSVLVSGGGDFNANRSEDWELAFAAEAFADAGERVLLNLESAASQPDGSIGAIADRCISMADVASNAAGDNFKLLLVAPGGSGLPSASVHPDPDQTAFWTFSRVLANEFPDLKVHRLDIALETDPETFASAVISAARNESNDTEFVLDGSALRAARVKTGFPEEGEQDCEAVTLGFDQPGSLTSLSWRALERREPGEDEVEIEVVATGLNFRDVMWSLGMLPDEALEDGYGGASLGLECSGRVLRAGANVSDLKVGDPVVAFTRAGFASHVTVPAFAVAKVDEAQDLVGAATVPVAFMTAYYSLITLGQLEKDQWVLIHGGAGGVGLAALQVAKSVGANIIATAGSDEKRNLLSLMGAHHVLDSRSLDFARQVMELTDGKGVHAVLNSLAGEAMERSIQTVRPFGRFLELGKRDFYENSKIGLRPFRKNVSYFGIDVDQLLSHDPALADRQIKAVFENLHEGQFSFLPYRVFDGENVQDAFRLMQRSGHIGKVLVKPTTARNIAEPSRTKDWTTDGAGWHIVIGGLGGFGGEITRWLADHGARRVALFGRSGVVDAEHQDLINALAERDVDVTVCKCDITQEDQVRSVLEDLRERAPIKGVVHAAMVLDDGLLSATDKSRFEKVLAPKVLGAKHLDELTKTDDLDYFILFSSMTTMVGNPGQANYVAANGYLEGLARARRAQGLKGLAVGWGAIRDVGFLARNAEVSDKLARHLGNAMIDAREGLDVLSEFLAQQPESQKDAVVHIGRFDWAAASGSLSLLNENMFRSLAKARSATSAKGGTLDLAEMLAGKGPKEATHLLCDLIAVELSEILRLPKEEIAFKRPLAEFGMDSLMGLELRMGIQKRFGIEIPLVSLAGGTCIEDFAVQILKRFTAVEEDGAGVPDSLKEGLAAQHLDTDLTTEQRVLAGKKVEQFEKKVGGLIG